MAAATATIDTVEAGDEVKVVMSGTVKKNVYGTKYIEDDKGRTLGLETDYMPISDVTVTLKSIPEPTGTGVVVRSNWSGRRFMRIASGKWRELNTGATPTVNTLSWSEVVKDSCTYGLMRSVERPIDVNPDNIFDRRIAFETTVGSKRSVEVRRADGALYIEGLSTYFKKDEAVRLARAILNANGLSA